MSKRIQLSRVLLEADGLKPLAPGPADATVRITKHTDEEVVIRVATDRSGFLRLADPYDAGWTATVDGTDTPVYPADLYFRAVFVEPGDHEVVFRYNGGEVWGPQLLSLLALLCVLVLGVLGRLTRPRSV